MFPVNFSTQRSERITAWLANGEPIGVARTVDEMLALAGACFFAIMSHGPLLRKAAAETQGKTVAEPQPNEHVEADDEMVFSDLHAAIEFVGHLTMLVHDEEYDKAFEGIVRCFVTQNDGKKTVVQFQGFTACVNASIV